MTGEKNRYKTHEKLWDLDDKSLKTPKHDEMILWLLNKENLKKLRLVENYKPIRCWFSTKEGENHLNPEELSSELRIFDEGIKIIHKVESEVPIKADNGFIIGYADLIIKPTPNKGVEQRYENPEFEFWKTPFLRDGNRFVYCRIEREFPKLIEVKPYIDSFGAVLRQLNTYKTYRPYHDFYLFTMDDRFKDAFESQGIKVLLPPKTKGDD